MKLIHALEQLPAQDALPLLAKEAFRSSEDYSHVTSVLAGYRMWDRVGADPALAIQALNATDIEVADRAEKNAEERLLDLLMPPQPETSESAERTREKLRERLRAGKLDDRMVEIDVRERGPTFEISTSAGLEEMDVNLKDVLPGLFGQRVRKRKMRVAEAAEYLVQEEEQKLIDMDQVTRIALERVERNGIIFLDEIDKIAGRESGHGPDVSREGVTLPSLTNASRTLSTFVLFAFSTAFFHR